MTEAWHSGLFKLESTKRRAANDGVALKLDSVYTKRPQHSRALYFHPVKNYRHLGLKYIYSLCSLGFEIEMQPMSRMPSDDETTVFTGFDQFRWARGGDRVSSCVSFTKKTWLEELSLSCT